MSFAPAKPATTEFTAFSGVRHPKASLNLIDRDRKRYDEFGSFNGMKCFV